jgi:hypothetical protein
MIEMSPKRSAPTRWGPERRLEFIDFRLMWDGRINRSELVDFFGISVQQASADLAHYAEHAPNNLSYDKRAKTYRAAVDFKPLLARSDAEHFLGQLGELAAGTESGAATFVGWRPPCDLVRFPARPVDSGILLSLLWAIRDGVDVHLLYQSMRRSAATRRWIAPHALASDGFRWHVRAWCYESGEYRDFVLSRMLGALGIRPCTVALTRDESWHDQIEVILRPRAGLSKGQRSAIEMDFGMIRGRLVVRCRKALVFYVVRQLQLERWPAASIAEQPLELENRSELSDLIEAGRKSPEATLLLEGA